MGVPIIQPLDDMEALLGWVPDADQACVCHTPLMGPISAPSGPQTLLCHDLSGGYLEDRYPQGVESPDKVCYRFYHWHLVDTFVYFSHHFVTIPPPGWVAAAHRHGTRVLGTLITEWEDGAGLMRAVLESDDSVSRVVGQLTAIARYYNFDGWLVNIENQIQSCDIAMLIRFVSALTEETHNALPHGQVIWYDSVTDKGELDWQNALNDLNSQYFDACDGIFLNYTWTETDLASSRERAIRSGRPWDVYVGVDVFGRNCFGGGGFNTAEAVGAARAQQLSVALFAVGWTLQCLPAENFEANENK